MPFLSINGLTVPVVDAAPRKSYVEIGQDVDRSVRGGTLFNGRRAVKRSWDVVAPVTDGLSAEALESWVTGLGVFHVGFDDGVAGDFGLYPDRGYTGQCVLNGVLFGGQGFAWRTINTTDVIRYRIPVRTRGTDWTWMAWFALAIGGPYTHLAVVNRGGTLTRYANGVVVATVSNVTVDNPTTNAIRFTLLSANQAGVLTAGVVWDDLVTFNFPVTQAMVQAIYNEGLAGRAHPPAPTINVRGDVLREIVPIRARAVMQSTDHLQGRMASGWQNNLRAVAFKLEEV